MKIVLLVSAVLIACLASTAYSLPVYLNEPNYGFVAYANSKQSGAGDKLSSCFACAICHSGVVATSANLNGFATDWKAAWVALESGHTTDESPNANSVQAWKNIESNDSDGDSNSNLTEITGGSNPGSALSTPGSPNCTAPGGSNTTLGSQSGPSYNLNALNSKCGFQGTGAGMIQLQDDPARDLEEVLLFLLPLFVLAYLKSRLLVKSEA